MEVEVLPNNTMKVIWSDQANYPSGHVCICVTKVEAYSSERCTERSYWSPILYESDDLEASTQYKVTMKYCRQWYNFEIATAYAYTYPRGMIMHYPSEDVTFNSSNNVYFYNSA